MSRLTEIMDHMTVVLNDLKTVMDAEQQPALCREWSTAAHCSALPKIKAPCWATLDYLGSSSDVPSNLRAIVQMMMWADRWQTITEKTQHLRGPQSATTAGYLKGTKIKPQPAGAGRAEAAPGTGPCMARMARHPAHAVVGRSFRSNCPNGQTENGGVPTGTPLFCFRFCFRPYGGRTLLP
ncbi:flagella synthesis chaperone protein FlgN [Leclercia adecarboxylata]|uniref:Flagella synthesis chaperone protein FlgN n=1 Tax=Leclercia adecarboxylata TaxID=83655 RepID=A0A4U9HQP6_9ENTR|nr:flagella synthesis chaperone protein FlgN [Leclercia adecarboxylata]